MDVRPSTAMQRLRAKAPANHALLARFGPQKHREPEWPYERRVSDGTLRVVAADAAASGVERDGEEAASCPTRRPSRRSRRCRGR